MIIRRLIIMAEERINIKDYVKCSSDIITNPTPQAPVLVEGLLRRGERMLISAASKAGKSTLLADLAICLAEGKDWLNFKIPSKNKVLFVNLENSAGNFENVIYNLYKAKGITEPNHNLYIATVEGFNITIEELIYTIVNNYKDTLDVIILDPIYSINCADENDTKEMITFFNKINVLKKQTGATIIYSHHHKKGDLKDLPPIDRPSGTGVIARVPEVIVDFLETDQTDTRGNKLYNFEFVSRGFKSPESTLCTWKWPLFTPYKREPELDYPVWDKPIKSEDCKLIRILTKELVEDECGLRGLVSDGNKTFLLQERENIGLCRIQGFLYMNEYNSNVFNVVTASKPWNRYSFYEEDLKEYFKNYK